MSAFAWSVAHTNPCALPSPKPVNRTKANPQDWAIIARRIMLDPGKETVGSGAQCEPPQSEFVNCRGRSGRDAVQFRDRQPAKSHSSMEHEARLLLISVPSQ